MDAGFCPPRYRLVSAQRHHLDEGQPHAGKRQRPMRPLLRAYLSVLKVQEVFLRLQGDFRADCPCNGRTSQARHEGRQQVRQARSRSASATVHQSPP